MRFYLKNKNSVKGKSLVLQRVLKKVINRNLMLLKNYSQSKNVFQNRLPAGDFSFLIATESYFFHNAYFILKKNFYLFFILCCRISSREFR